MSYSFIAGIDSHMMTSELPHSCLPFWIRKAFDAFHAIHQIWHWHLRLSQVYSNSNNFRKLVAGTAVNIFFGDSRVLRVAAQAVLVARRTWGCIQQSRELVAAYRQFSGNLRGHYYVDYSSYAVAKKMPTAVSSWHSVAMERVKRVWQSSVVFLRQAFSLSMRMMDFVEAFSLQEADQRAAVNEVFVHSSDLIDELANNKPNLLRAMEENRDLLKAVLQRCHSAYTVDDLKTAVVRISDVTVQVAQLSSVVSQQAEKTFAVGWRTLTEAFF